MNYLESSIVADIKKLRMKKLEEHLAGLSVGLNICPLCNYTSKNNPKGSAKVFSNGSMKCFSCGEWRRGKK